ncbi:MAG: hypothetical protein ACLU8V_07725 [Oscillospiraceae bacterium]
MNRRDFSRRLADIAKELKNIHLKLIMQDDRERKQWFINAQDRLNQEKKELGNKILDL